VDFPELKVPHPAAECETPALKHSPEWPGGSGASVLRNPGRH